MNHTSLIIDPHIQKRLEDEKIVWLTTVNSSGTPQPNPVWFYWDGMQFIIYTPPASAKVKNIARNRMVSLNFEGAEIQGGDVVVFSGEANMHHNCLAAAPGYIQKYMPAANEWGRTPEDLIAEYSVEITIVPTRIRTF
jgi:PPOX class probable F420-dependent enzyme